MNIIELSGLKICAEEGLGEYIFYVQNEDGKITCIERINMQGGIVHSRELLDTEPFMEMLHSELRKAIDISKEKETLCQALETLSKVCDSHSGCRGCLLRKSGEGCLLLYNNVSRIFKEKFKNKEED